MEINEGNKLIAEFMGAPYIHKYGFADQMGYEYNGKDIDNEYDGKVWVSKNYLRYHSSWDWIMPVVEKINNISLDDYGEIGVYIKPNICLIGEDEHNPLQMSTITNHPKIIEMVWTTLISFVQWYNTLSPESTQK